MAGRPGFGLRCDECGGLRSVTVETRGDPGERQARIIRVRRCSACGHRFETVELVPASRRVRLPDLRVTLAHLRRDRYLVRKS